jgi:transcriptional regulator with XRE-family HTH domain
MQAALSDRHMGRVVRAFRRHLHHGRPSISQASVASWAGITQAQLSRVENGPPIVHLDRLTHWAEILGIPAEYLWFRLPEKERTSHPDKRVDVDVKRSEFLRLGGLAAAGMSSGSLFLSNRSANAVTEQDCAQWLAWELWHQDRASLHESEIPLAVVRHLAPYTAGMGRVGLGIIFRDPQGLYGFAHPSFLNFFVAQRIFDNIVSGGGALFSAAQTSHEIDLAIRDLVSRNRDSVELLRTWMKKASSSVLRVNCAGVLAKLGSATDETEEVLASLKRDQESRQLYLTAVTSRVLGVPWREACQVAISVEEGTSSQLIAQLSNDRSSEIARKFAEEIHNPRDGGARWCSTVILGSLRDRAPGVATQALQEALRSEHSRENIRSIGSALAGSSPIAF